MSMVNKKLPAAAKQRGKLFKIGEVSKLTGIGIETLRFYEKIGLLSEPSRTDSGYRLYDESVMERLEFVKRAQLLGFTLNEIGRIIAEKAAGQNPCAEVRGIVRQRLQELDERIAQMRKYRKELADALAQWDKAKEVKGHVCGLIEGTAIKHPLTAPDKRRKI